MSRSRWWRALATVATVVVAGVGAVVAAVPASADVDRPVVLVGVPGLQWTDAAALTDVLDPVLAADDLGVGSLVVRSTGAVACPVDGWLAISAGNRASGSCSTLADPTDDAWADAWQSYRDAAAAASFTAEPGLLGDELATAGIDTAAIGAGAAVALADSTGEVEDYQPYLPESIAGQVGNAVADHDLVVVDTGSQRFSPVSSLSRDAALANLATELSAILQGAQESGRDPIVIVSGISDGPVETDAALRLVATIGLGGGQLSSASTRQPGYVLATDQHSTILALLGVEEGATSAIGAALSVTPADADWLVDAAVDRQHHADAQRPLIPGFFLTLVLLNLALYAVVALGLRGTRVVRTVAPRREPVLRVLRAVSLGIAAIPIASFLTNLLPWWRAGVPLLALLAGTAAVAAAIVALALLGPWRRALLGPAAFVAGVTSLVLAVDVLAGARLQVSAIMGIPTLVAGRFYGMNNTSFSLFSASLLVLVTALTNALVQRGRRGWAAATVAVLGIAAIAVDGAPFWGADFGGPPALLVAFGLLGLLAAGVRLTIKKVVLVVLGSAVVTMGIAVLDWLRPPASRTHLGRFFADVLDGDLWTVVGRKLDQNLTILLGNRPLTILAICGVLLVVGVLIRPVRNTITSPDGGEYAWLSGGAPISAMARQAPMLAPGLAALAICAGIGFAVNDSGIAIPALSVAIAVPLLLASCARWMLDQPATPVSSDQVSSGSTTSTSSGEESGSGSSTTAP